MTAVRCPHCQLPQFSERTQIHCEHCDWHQCPSCGRWYSHAKAPRHETEEEQ
jgi:uncharacterized Zn finger protein (UPF0148 family)